MNDDLTLNFVAKVIHYSERIDESLQKLDKNVTLK